MTIRGLVTWAMLCFALLLAACGGGSGRRGADLVVTGTGPTSQVLGGTSAVFVMTVTNAGPDNASNVKINDLVGNQLALTSITCNAAGGAVCPDVVGVSMTVPTLPVGSSLVFTVTVQLSPTAKGTIANSMSAQDDGEHDQSNNQFTVTAPAYTVTSNLVVAGSGPGGSVTGGGTAVFVMTVTNVGPDDAANVRITDSVGTGMTLSGVTCTASNGAVCPTPGPVMSLAGMPNGGVLAFTVNTAVGANVNGTVVNSMSVSADTDTDRSDNSFTATVSVVTPTNGVFVTGVGPSGTLVGGGSAVFTMQVGNSGPDAAATVGIVNQVGAGLNFTGVTCAASGRATCPATTGPVMTVASLPAGGTLTFSVHTNVVPGTNGVVTNNMSVTAANDTDRTDNSATAVGTVATPRASLVLTGTAPAAQVLGGGTAVFQMTVANTGPDPATNVRVGNMVGSNLTFTGATCTATGGANCPASVGVIANVGTLPVGGLLTFNVSATVATGTNGAITNTVQATADNDANPSGNTAVAVGQAFTARSNVTVTGVGPSNVPGGNTANFQMTVSNSGPQSADAVHLVNTVGSNLTQTSTDCTTSGGAACPASLGPVMDASNLPVGGSLVFNIAATVSAGTQGTIINILDATVTSGTRSSVTGVAVGSAYSNNVSVNGTAPVGPLVGGGSAVFAMSVNNAGPGPAQNVSINNILGSGLSPGGAITCVAGNGAVCPPSPGATMTVATLPANGSLTFTVPVVVDAGTNGNVSSTMMAAAAGDVRSNDNSATVSVSAASVDLGVSESGATQVAAGSTAVFTAAVNNPGPAAVSNLMVGHALSGVAGNSATITCSASAGANCPDTSSGTSFAVPTLGAGRTLTFTITVPVPLGASGAIVSTTTVSAAGDPNSANNQASFSTVAADARNGSYKVFAANGRLYDMVIDFDHHSYTISGGALGAGALTSFTPPAAGNEYTVSGIVRFRVATDLIVGGHDFGAGVLPYVAARNFGSALSDAQGQYDLATRDTPVSGSAVTRAGTAVVATDGTLFICQLASGTPKPVSNCSSGATSYKLSVNANFLYTATPIGGGASYDFYLLRTGASKVLISAGAAVDAGGNPIQRFRIGLQDLASLAGGMLVGASATPDWVTLTLSASSYAFTGLSGATDSAPLLAIPNSGATSMLFGTLGSDPLTTIYVMQAGPLVVVSGGFNTPVGGLLQIAVP